MANATALETPLRVGVFPDIARADRAVESLIKAGFTTEQISVLCSDKAIEAHYRPFEHQDPAGANTAAAVVTGGAIGVALGGLTLLAGVVTTGGFGILAAGGLVAWTGGVVGGLIGAMLTRGVEKELANYYDQAVEYGAILVAAEEHGERQPQMLAKAAAILADCGAEPIALPEG